jgi:DHA1 family tetracycline resistance protein-like MFS transporter
MAGHALAYGMLVFADSVHWLVLSRILSGVTSANLAAAYAYVSDITPAERRQQGFAQVSAAFALGFALGPALGGLLTGAQSPTSADLDPPAIAAAALSLVALAGIGLLLPESHRTAATRRAEGSFGGPHDALAGADAVRRHALRDEALQFMLVLGVLVFLFASMRESILSLWLHDRFAFDTHAIGLVFTINGIAIALVQTLVTAALARRFGTIATLRGGVACYALSWLGLVLAPGLPAVALAMIAGAFGTALFGTSLQTLVSMRSTSANRGAVMGLYQSGSSLARFFGAALSGSLFALLGRDMPFALGAAAMIPALALTFAIARRVGPLPRAPRS